MERRLFVKRFLLLIPVFLFLTMAGCGTAKSTQQSAGGAAQTLQVQAVPTAFTTPGPAENQIVGKINDILSAPGDGLASTIDAAYFVDGVVFGQDNKGLTLYVQAHCQCALNGSCCNLEHTFVVVATAMRVNGANIVGWIPPGLNELQVVCYDHAALLGTVTVPWSDMQNYMLNIINGYQLGGLIKKTPVKK
jgi:hypothetical protein